MLYALFTGLLFAALYAISALEANSPALPITPFAAFVLMSVSVWLPRHFFSFTLENVAPEVLSRLMRRAVIGVSLVLAAALASLFLINSWRDPVLLGEVYVYTLIGVGLYQIIGEVMTNQVIYLQLTNQYNTNQLFAILLGLAVILFVLILYFLAFDLASPPNLLKYLRDMLAVTVVVVGYGRALFLMAHH